MLQKPDIVIVGAGAAGIFAAATLIRNGLENVTILEAEDRIGGRINSVEFGGSVVDLGAQWVHGESFNIVYQMAKDTNLNLLAPSHNDYEEYTYYISEGKPVDKRLIDPLYKLALKILTDQEAASAYDGTYGEYFLQKYNHKVKEVFGDERKMHHVAKLIEDWAQKLVCCWDSCTSWHEISTKGAFSCEKHQGNQYLNWKDKGYRTVLDIITGKLPGWGEPVELEDKILLNKEVDKIIWKDNPKKPGKVSVKCKDGSMYYADHVIVTVSIGVLKETYKTMFVPDLPPEKVNAIEHIPLGTVNKILLKFPKKWWTDDVKGFSFLWTEEDRKTVAREFPHGPHYHGKSWLEDIFGFYVIDSHPSTLLGWVVGKMAGDVETLSDQVVTEGCMWLLRKFVGNTFDILEPDGILRSKWKTNPHFRGSYSHTNIEMEQNRAERVELGKQMSDNDYDLPLLFAGEATFPTRFATVDGAIQSGSIAADYITKCYM